MHTMFTLFKVVWRWKLHPVLWGKKPQCFMRKSVPVTKRFYSQKFRQFLVCYSIADLSSVQIPKLFHFHECLTEVVTLPIWNFLLNQALYTLMLYSWSEAKKTVLKCKDLSKDEMFIFSVKAQLAATAHPRHEHTHMLAMDESRKVSTASFQQLRHNHFRWRAPNYLAWELKITCSW